MTEEKLWIRIICSKSRTSQTQSPGKIQHWKLFFPLENI